MSLLYRHAWKRIEQPNDEVATVTAFNSKTNFGPEGRPTKVDRPTFERPAETVLSNSNDRLGTYL